MAFYIRASREVLVSGDEPYELNLGARIHHRALVTSRSGAISLRDADATRSVLRRTAWFLKGHGGSTRQLRSDDGRPMDYLALDDANIGTLVIAHNEFAGRLADGSLRAIIDSAFPDIPCRDDLDPDQILRTGAELEEFQHAIAARYGSLIK